MVEVVAKQKLGWRTLARALRNRKTGFMALFGFASGLPFALFLGTLYAWLSEAEVDLETMGVFSLIGLLTKLFTDIAYTWVDPRVKFSGNG